MPILKDFATEIKLFLKWIKANISVERDRAYRGVEKNFCMKGLAA